MRANRGGARARGGASAIRARSTDAGARGDDAGGAPTAGGAGPDGGLADDAGSSGSDAAADGVGIGDCPALTIDHCRLAATASGGSFGACSAGYSGWCAYACQGGDWTAVGPAVGYGAPWPLDAR